MTTKDIQASDMPQTLHHRESKSVGVLLKENPYVAGVAMFASLGGFLFGYDQGVVSGVITMESLRAAFPKVFTDNNFKGCSFRAGRTSNALPSAAVSCSFSSLWVAVNAMIYYAPIIFSQLGLSGNTSSLHATGVYGIVNTLSTIPALLLIDRLRRRRLSMAGAAGTMVSLVIVGGIIGGFGSSLVSHKAAGWVGIALIYIYDINFSYSFAPIGWVLPSEIFNLGNRSRSISMTTSATWRCKFIIGLITPSMVAKLGWGTYIFFAAFCSMAFFFVWFCVPETKGKSLEDMDVVFGDTAAHGEEKLHLYQIFADLRDDEGFIVGSEKA
ncbi:hypothetical protein LTR97_008609 [Elasticomyces elasticus]|uniref:Major facilitator superfamily (MFS) profile domain-containing protein n=1 Tax=Elasticomyces elasticus TaxID=574655 RepID=A0AAN7W879_9PEZI|nr:hypothetical protein LTR97_008609 [Elasticomyces elasticus]